MDERLVTALRVVAAALVFATAAYHLAWGLPRALIYLEGIGFLLSQGNLPDIRPFLFVVFALLLFAGPYLVTRDVVSLRRGYQLGIAVLGLSIATWMAWHLTDHAAFLYANRATTATAGTTHAGVVETVVGHYLSAPVDATIKTIELGGILAFGALWRWDPAIRDSDEPDAAVESTATQG